MLRLPPSPSYNDSLRRRPQLQVSISAVQRRVHLRNCCSCCCYFAVQLTAYQVYRTITSCSNVNAPSFSHFVFLLTRIKSYLHYCLVITYSTSRNTVSKIQRKNRSKFPQSVKKELDCRNANAHAVDSVTC